MRLTHVLRLHLVKCYFLVFFLLYAQSILASAENDIALGAKLYRQNCAACHSQDLSGGTGFNLKDGLWVHGDKPQDIVKNIQSGFMSAGMPAFGAILTKTQIESIAAFVLSKREGFSGLTYKLYQMNDNNDRTLSAEKLIKSGQLNKGLADFQLSEVPHYILIFEGDFYAPKDIDARIWAQWGFVVDVDFEVDGVLVKRDVRFGDWYPTWPLKRGKQHLKITYRSGDSKPGQRNPSFIVTNDDMSIKLFGVSNKGHELMTKKTLELIATTKSIVQRVKVLNIPPKSISVGMPQKINYAFNTNHCSIVGLWTGDMLNIGPNVGGRGEDASLPLGNWIFHAPQMLVINAPQPCNYKGYQKIDNEPVFKFAIGENEFELSTTATYQSEIHFHFQVKTQPNTPVITQQKITLTLPESTKISWYSGNGMIKNNTATLKVDPNGQFTLSARLN